MKKKFTLLIFAILASLGAMASPPQQDEGNVAKWNNTEYPTLQEALDAAEEANPKTIVIDLLTDAELDVSARNSPRSIGTTDTESITINGGNNKLTINLLDSDWSDVSTANDSKTKLILNNLNLASGKYNSGHWKRNGIFFSCAVQMNNVNASCGIGFKNDATLNNVTVNTTGSNYAVWIQSNGETVNIEGLTVNGGRGIKIADEDAGKETVSLNVNYSKFTTTEKAAILASTKYGAEITIGSGNDISGVVADTENIVWVDEEWASYFNTINVTGATKTLEGSIAKIGDNFYASIADAVAAASAGDVIKIFKAGTYTLPEISKNVTIEGTVDGVEFTHTSAGSVASIPNGCTFKNITFNFGNVNYHGFQHAGTINMEGCTLNGKFFSYGDMNFTDCEFNQTNADYHMWAYAGNLVYTDCTFTNSAEGKFINVFNEGGATKYTVTANNCKFVNNAASSSKAALNVKVTCGDKSLQYDVYVNSCTTEGAFPEVSKSDALYVLNSVVQVDDRKAAVEDRITVTENGVLIYPVYVAQYKDTKYTSLQAALDAAEADDEHNISIDLLDDATLDINAWSGTDNSQAIGTTNTQSITINGNSHKLTFMTKNTDWNNIATMNDSQTKLVLKNMTIDQGGVNTKGTWNSYDINFNCAVELNNVTAKRALAFKNSATLKDVTVNQAGGSSDVYGIWISPRVENQTINIDGLKLTASAENGKTGRGIKVDDEYQSNSPKVTLSVANSSFTTEKKAAILLKSAGGVDVIDGGGNNIEGVAADKVNLVWVDEGDAENFYRYSVTGATMVPETKETDYVARLSNAEGKILGYYNGTSALANAVAASDAGYTVTIFKAGEYTMPGLPKNITVEGGVDGVVFNHTSAGNIAAIPNGATFKNVSFNFGNVDYHGFQHAGTINMEGCTLNGKFFSYGDMNFTNCEFNHSGDYHMWTYAGNITYTGCTFTNETKGKFLNVYNDQGIDPAYTVKVTDCKFINKGESSKAALNVKATYTDSNKVQHEVAYDVTITNCTTEGAFPAETITQSLVVLNNLAQVDDRTATGVDYITVTHDGVQIYPFASVAKIGEVGYPTLQLAVDAAYTMTGDVTINLVADITEYALVKQKENLNLTIDGKDGEENHKIIGQIFIDGMGRNTGAETLTITNVKFEAGNFYSGTDAFVNVPSTKTTGTPWYDKNHNNHAHNITVSNCTFTGAENTNTAVAIRTNSGTDGSTNLTFVNNTAANLHSFAQLTAVAGMSITGNVVSATGSFVNISGGNEGDAIFSGNKFISAKLKDNNYAVRIKGSSAATVTLTNNEFEAPYIVQYGDGSKLTQNLSIESGIYVGDIIFDAAAGTTGKIVISDGHFSAPLGNSDYAKFIAEGKSGVNGIYLAETPQAPNGLGDAVAVLTDPEGKSTNYASLEAAFGDATDGSTIKLLVNSNGNGIVAPQGKFSNDGLTVDFNGKTYTVDGTLVGSAGTETQAFQLLKGNNITFKGGTIYSENALFLVQNYSTLTLEGMTLTLNNAEYQYGYTLSNNNGNVVIDGTTINANPAGQFAFDVCRNSSYPSVSVTVKGGSQINGDVEVSASGNNAMDGFLLMLESGKINGDIVLDASAKAAMAATPDKALVREYDTFNQEPPAEYMWQNYEEGKSQLVPAVYVAQIGDVKYTSLAKAVAAVPADGTETTIQMIDNHEINSNDGVTIPATKNVVLDLNGKTVTGVVMEAKAAQAIKNIGTLTITDTSEGGAGVLTNKADEENSGQWTERNWATNVITNTGTLTIAGGSIVNTAVTNICYAIDNNSTSYDATLNVTGGLITTTGGGQAVRLFCNSTTKNNTINISGGTVKGKYAGFWVQLPGSSAQAKKATVNITGGKVEGESYAWYDYSYGDVYTAVNYNITGGFFKGYIYSYGAQNSKFKVLDGFISGGYFSEEISSSLIVEGKACVDNTEAETKDEYPYVIGLPEVYYAWFENGNKVGEYCRLESPFVNEYLMDGEFIDVLKDINLSKNIECKLAAGAFTLTFGDYTITKGDYSVSLLPGVTVYTDKQTDIFSAATEGYSIYELTTETGYAYTCGNYVAKVNNDLFKTFSEAATAAAGTKVILLLQDISDLYTMSVGETLRVEKAGKAFDDPAAPDNNYTVNSMIEGPVTIYSLKAAEQFAAITDGYYHIKNLGNEKYVNVKGRKTATVDATADDIRSQAGTVIKVKATNGQVEVLRSQAIDIPHYAERAMSYVPDVAKLLVEKLNATGSGEILGTTGFDAIMQKFNDSFDYHLYTEQAEGGVRIFGRTPSMKPVVEFYNEHKANVDAKLPQLESYINSAIAKVVDKVGKGNSLKKSFKLHTIWERMDNNALTEPNDDDSKLAFLQQVLASETNVWNFAYQTATFYMEKVEESSVFDQIPAELRNYWNLAKQVRPGFKYYIVQKDGKMDFISEGNIDIKNNVARTIWVLEPATEFDVEFNVTNKDGEGFATLYTDFGYQLPEGVTALKVTGIDADDIAQTEEIGNAVAAQTPVLLKAPTAGKQTLTIGNYGAAVSGNEIHGADYLIDQYTINEPALESLFQLLAEASKTTAEKYDYLQRKNSGTVNNKYFFPMTDEDVTSGETPIRILSTDEEGTPVFAKTWTGVKANEAFMVSETIDPIYLDIPTTPDAPATIDEAYYRIKNLGNNQYVNVQGRKTATVDATEETAKTLPGTIIKVKSTIGVVDILRSQAIDIPHYAERAMTYVPEFAELIVQKLGATGSGQILGTTGFDAIMQKFNDSFDYHLHVVYADEEGDKYRIYGQIPTMKPVVEFYNEHKANVDYKLKDLETAVNGAIDKLVDKLGRGESLRNTFSLETIWQRMGSKLTKPADEATKLTFLQEVLSNETNVWDFAYQTVTFYMEKVENSQYFDKLPDNVKSYWNRAKNVHPGFKYYIVQKDNKMDIISQGNIDIQNDDLRTMWALEPVETMTINVPEANSRIVGATFDENGKRTGFETGYYTTLYTDFAYQLPEGVVALKVKEIKDAMLGDEPLTYESGDATLTLGLLVTEEIGQEVPAQTPVLIMSKTAGDIDITIGDDFGASADVADNLLHGADYLIEQYEINTPALEGLFDDMVKEEKVSSDLTDKYEHLIRKNSGTVNNKFFFSVNINEELANAYKKKTGNEMKTSPVLTLSKLSGKKLAFNESWDNIQPNSVILVSEQTKPALFTLTGDVTRDGDINAQDVTGQVNIIQFRDKQEYNYDYEAADVIYVEDADIIETSDVTGEVNIIQKRTKHPDLP